MEKMGGQKKRSFFQKPKKWAISLKKKGPKMGGLKNRPFLKNGDAKSKKNGPTPCGRKKIQLFV